MADARDTTSGKRLLFSFNDPLRVDEGVLKTSPPRAVTVAPRPWPQPGTTRVQLLSQMEVDMELIIMSLGGSLVALSLQLSELIHDRAAFASIQSVLALAEHIGLCRGPMRAARRLA